MTSETTCGRCGRAPTTHIHQAEPGPYVASDCAFAGRAYEPGACTGDDLCDGCLATLYTEDADGQMVTAPWVGAPGRVDGYAMIVAARRAKVEG